MICPNCGKEQVESFECVNCGVIFAKFQAHQSRPREREVHTGWSRPIGTASRVMRAAIGATAIGLAVLMYLNGHAIRSFGPYVALVLFAGSGLYYLLSVADRISLGRFAAEAVVTAVLSGALFVSLPDVFSLRKPMYASAKPPPTREAQEFLDAVRAFTAGTERFLATTEVRDTDSAEALTRVISMEALRRTYATIPDRDRGVTQPVYVRFQGLLPLLDPLVRQFPAELPRGPAVWVPAAIASDIRHQLGRVNDDIDRAEAALRQVAPEQPQPEGQP